MGVKLNNFKEFLLTKIVPYVVISFLGIIIVSQYLHITSLKNEVEFLSKRTRYVVIDVVGSKKGTGIRIDTIHDTIKVIK
jgi:hypothetical protein